MADFCGRCLVWDDMSPSDAENNDMRGEGPIQGLCEGCGKHIFDRHGWPICAAETSSWYEDPEQDFLAPCKVCWPLGHDDDHRGPYRTEDVVDTRVCRSCYYRTAMLGGLRVHIHTRETGCRPGGIPDA